MCTQKKKTIRDLWYACGSDEDDDNVGGDIEHNATLFSYMHYHDDFIIDRAAKRNVY